MNLTTNFALLLLLVMAYMRAAAAEDLDDISFDDDEPAGQGLDDLSENGDGSTGGSLSFAESEAQRRAMLKKVLNEAFKRPGSKTRFGQVLPIVRLMSPPQKLALASLVMSQVMAGPDDPPPSVTDSKNITSQLMLPISMDIATMFRGLGKEQPAIVESAADKNEGRSSNSALNSALMAGIFSQQRVSLGPNIRRPPPTLNSGISRRNANVQNEKPYPKRRPWPGPKIVPKATTTTRKPPTVNSSCTTMTNNLCVELNDYPEKEILSSLQKEINKEIVRALTNEPNQLKEVDHKPKYLERRQGDSGEQTKRQMCTATSEYARPKKARATSGQWKYIVNTGDYTQTLRLELCSNPQSQCLYLADDVDSTCEQVFNYHRLLTWDETAGLTMDVFKVPTCCSCKVLGYGGLPFSHSTGVPPGLGSVDHPDTNLVGNEDPPVVRIPPPPPSLPPTTSNVKNQGHGIRVRPYAPPKRRPTVQHRGPPLPIEGETAAGEDLRYPPFDNNLRRITRNNTVDSRVKYTTHLLMPPSPNNRHPALPIDSIHADSMPAVTVASPIPTSGHGYAGNGLNHGFTVSTGPPVSSTAAPSSNHGIASGASNPGISTGQPNHGIGSGPGSNAPSSPNRRVNYSYHPIIDYFRPQISQLAENRMGLDWTPIMDRRRGKSADKSEETDES